MAETKYGKYFISGPRPGGETGAMKVIADLDGDVIQGSNSYFVHWVPRHPEEFLGLTSWGQISHGPHVHKSAELIMHIGTNPDDPLDLGGEIELFMGPEMEKHTITKSTVVYIPPNFIHCPWTIKRVDRPFIIVQVNQEPRHTEKSLKKLVPEKDLDRMLFIDEGYDSKERVVQFPKGLKQG
ncbi:MAG: hypothetical protein KAV68_02335 [Dehalococcoidales bacterium]|nr:hypothetical protein [Dehalococcoidales bacterium]